MNLLGVDGVFPGFPERVIQNYSQDGLVPLGYCDTACG